MLGAFSGLGNLNGVCPAGSGPSLGIIPFGIVLGMELEVGRCCGNRGAAWSLRDQECSSVQALPCSQLSLSLSVLLLTRWFGSR